ncbi:MAG: efflux RND transporter periplasmic adaptor subunit [Candidatus Gracilibacteria bacterium]|nr:efflux RND transporter periplasmic adaptor subunit [Candidatus Gracilibacteria bacterium]
MKSKISFNLKYFLSGMVLVLLINYNTFLPSLGSSSTNIASTESSNLKVELGNIEESIDVVGNSELVDEQSLKFTKAGTITKVYYKAGDSIKKGDIIAEIDNSDAYDAIEEAKISLENAKLSLSDLYDDVDESKKLQAENNIITAQKNLEIANTELINLKSSQENSLNKLTDSISISEKELLTAKSNLTISESELDILKKEKENSYNNTISNKDNTIIQLENGLSSELSNISKTLEQVDYILGVTPKNENKNDYYDIYLGAKLAGVKDSAKTSFGKSLSYYTALDLKINNFITGDTDELQSIFDDFLVLYKELENTTNLTYNTLESSVESSTFSQSDIDSKKSSMSSYRSNAQSKIISITSSINNLKTLTNTDLLSQTNANTISQKEASVNSSKLSIEKQEKDIESSKKSYEQTKIEFATSIKSKENNIKSLENNLELVKITQTELLDGPTSSNITKANNSIKQAELKLKSAYENLDDYTLTAPFDGVVRKIDYMVGDNLTTDNDKYVYIENPNLLEITVKLDQIDIMSVKLGMEATVTFDAYPTVPVKAVISSIDTTPISSSGVVSYEVKLILSDEDFKGNVLSGFSADVKIITTSKNDILLLKSSAITEKEGKYYVNLLKNGSSTETEITVGLASGGKTEILSGLNEGDEVSIKEFSVTTKEDTSSKTLFSTPTRTGGNPDRQPGGF